MRLAQLINTYLMALWFALAEMARKFTKLCKLIKTGAVHLVSKNAARKPETGSISFAWKKMRSAKTCVRFSKLASTRQARLRNLVQVGNQQCSTLIKIYQLLGQKLRVHLGLLRKHSLELNLARTSDKLALLPWAAFTILWRLSQDFLSASSAMTVSWHATSDIRNSCVTKSANSIYRKIQECWKRFKACQNMAHTWAIGTRR